MGRLLGHAMRRFDARVLALMAHDVQVPLALSNLAAREQVSAAHVQITRHLALGGSRLTELAQRAGMTKQAMGDLVDQCVAWGLVVRETDAHDARGAPHPLYSHRPRMAAGFPAGGHPGRGRVSRRSRQGCGGGGADWPGNLRRSRRVSPEGTCNARERPRI